MRSRYHTVSLVVRGKHIKRICGINKRGRVAGVSVIGVVYGRLNGPRDLVACMTSHGNRSVHCTVSPAGVRGRLN